MDATKPSNKSRTLKAVADVLIPLAVILAVLLVLLATLYLSSRALGAGRGEEDRNPDGETTQADEPPALDAASQSEACRLARLALADGDAKQAVALLEAIHVTDDNAAELSAPHCQATWVLASALSATEPPVQTGAEKIGKAWDDFVKTYVTPFAGASGFVLAGWLALFVLARLLVELPVMRAMQSDRASRHRVGALGWALLAITPLAGVVYGAVGQSAGGGFIVATWALIVALAAIGVFAVACWLATIRALKIEVTHLGDSDEAKAVDRGAIATQLRALSRASGSIELPNGPYVSGLVESLKDLSKNPWAGAAQSITLFLLGAAPWTASITVYSDTRAAVAVTRNGGTRVLTTVSTGGAGLKPLDDPPEGTTATKGRFLATFLAAHIVMELRASYPEDMEGGLYGATDASGIALQYIATTWYAKSLDTSDAQTLLQTALGRDPFNKLAQYSLTYLTHRHQTAPETLIAFGDQLDAWLKQDLGAAGADELPRAMVLTRAAAARNLAAVSLAQKPADTEAAKNVKRSATRALKNAREAAAALTWTDDSPDRAASQILARRIALARAVLVIAEWQFVSGFEPPPGPSVRARLDAALGALDRQLPTAATRESHDYVRTCLAYMRSCVEDEVWTTTPALAYSLATALVCWWRAPLTDPVVTKLLGAAFQLEVYKQFATKDPELSAGEGFDEWKRAQGSTRGVPADLHDGSTEVKRG